MSAYPEVRGRLKMRQGELASPIPEHREGTQVTVESAQAINQLLVHD
jgi:hypothetical protein